MGDAVGSDGEEVTELPDTCEGDCEGAGAGAWWHLFLNPPSHSHPAIAWHADAELALPQPKVGEDVGAVGGTGDGVGAVGGGVGACSGDFVGGLLGSLVGIGVGTSVGLSVGAPPLQDCRKAIQRHPATFEHAAELWNRKHPMVGGAVGGTNGDFVGVVGGAGAVGDGVAGAGACVGFSVVGCTVGEEEGGNDGAGVGAPGRQTILRACQTQP